MRRAIAAVAGTLALSSLQPAFAADKKVPTPEQVERHATMKSKAVPTASEAWALLRSLRASESVIAELDKSQALFTRPDDQVLTPDERRGVLDLWATLIEYEVGFDAVKDRFRDSWYAAKTDNDAAKAFVMAYAAYVGQQRATMALVDMTTSKPVYEKLLDEGAPEMGISAGHLSRLKKHALSAKAAVVLRSGRDFLGSLDKRFLAAGILEEGPFKELVWHTREGWEKTDKLYWKHGFKLFAQSKLGFAKDALLGAVFPVQKGVAEWMGDTRYRRQGKNLISPAQVEALAKRMEPGDIVLERRNWYLSNVGLPGFWPHAELHTGTSDEMAAYFDQDPEVLKAYPEGFTAWLAQTFPEQWKTLQTPAHDGTARRIAEAVSEGVVFSSALEAMEADYIGVLRPRLAKVEKARAIARAFAHYGKPYDFDFDFQTDQTLVCSELVFKAYQAPTSEGRSLNVPLARMAGRTTLPPNDFARIFDEEFDKPSRQFDFVGFLDGREKEGCAVEGTEADLRASYKRAKWDFAQK